jgi:hypothetical protein
MAPLFRPQLSQMTLISLKRLSFAMALLLRDSAPEMRSINLAWAHAVVRGFEDRNNFAKLFAKEFDG